MLPVAELHVHIEGTLEPDLLVRLAARNDVALPSTDPAVLRARYRFGSLRDFLDLYYANLSVLKHEQDFYDLARAYLTRAAAAGVRRAEIFFDPQTHLGHGVPLAAMFGGLTAALADGERDHGVSADLILCFLRDLGPDAAARRSAPRCRSGTSSSASDSIPPRSATRPRCSPRSTSRPRPRACGWSRTRGRRAARTPCTRRSTCCTSSASTTACGPWRTPGWSRSCGTGRSR